MLKLKLRCNCNCAFQVNSDYQHMKADGFSCPNCGKTLSTELNGALNAFFAQYRTLCNVLEQNNITLKTLKTVEK